MPVREIEGLMSTEGQIISDPAAVEERYANYFKIGHNLFNFILEFAHLYSDPPVEKVHTRIVTSPGYAKELLAVLTQAIADYERAFGSISVDR
jgi:Protein of unknown function (DUF3467)